MKFLVLDRNYVNKIPTTVLSKIVFILNLSVKRIITIIKFSLFIKSSN